MSHPNVGRILHSLDLTVKEENENFVLPVIVMERYDITLNNFIITARPSVDERLYIVQKMICGIDYIHSQHIIHYDLKPENIMITTRNKHLHLYIVDFGLAKRSTDPYTKFHHKSGTPPWMAPEIFRGEGHDFPADLFALAHLATAVMVCAVECQDADCKLCKQLSLWAGQSFT